jgi:hypothetical protein
LIKGGDKITSHLGDFCPERSLRKTCFYSIRNFSELIELKIKPAVNN